MARQGARSSTSGVSRQGPGPSAADTTARSGSTRTPPASTSTASTGRTSEGEAAGKPQRIPRVRWNSSQRFKYSARATRSEAGSPPPSMYLMNSWRVLCASFLVAKAAHALLAAATRDQVETDVDNELPRAAIANVSPHEALLGELLQRQLTARRWIAGSPRIPHLLHRVVFEERPPPPRVADPGPVDPEAPPERSPVIIPVAAWWIARRTVRASALGRASCLVARRVGVSRPSVSGGRGNDLRA